MFFPLVGSQLLCKEKTAANFLQIIYEPIMNFTEIDGLVIVVWDVQHGNAIFIKTPNNKYIVIDMGVGNYSKEDDEKFSPLEYLSKKCGIKNLDLMIISHPHKDHIDDILNFDLVKPRQINKLNVGNELLDGARSSDEELFKKYITICNDYDRTVTNEESMNNPENTDGVETKVFRSNNFANTDYNNRSIITVITYGDFKIVIPGDNEKESLEDLLINNSGFKTIIEKADILVAPHHGRESGYLSAFVSHISPKLVIISDGKYKPTSANPKYSYNGSGMTTCNHSTHKVEERKMLTTNSDKEILINVNPVKNGNYNPTVLFNFL